MCALLYEINHCPDYKIAASLSWLAALLEILSLVPEKLVVRRRNEVLREVEVREMWLMVQVALGGGEELYCKDGNEMHWELDRERSRAIPAGCGRGRAQVQVQTQAQSGGQGETERWCSESSDWDCFPAPGGQQPAQ